jgi:hypothetical protein
VSNASTIRRQIAGTQQLTIAPLLGSIITTTETAFQLNNNGLTLTGGGVIPLSAGVTGLYQGTGQVLVVRASGQYSGATASSTTLELELQEVPAALLPIANTLAGAQTFTNWNEIATTGVKTLGTAVGSWQFEAFLQLDAAGNLEGTFEANIDGQIVTPTITNVITGLVGEADLNFVITAVLGTATTGVVLTMTEFGLDLQ